MTSKNWASKLYRNDSSGVGGGEKKLGEVVIKRQCFLMVLGTKNNFCGSRLHLSQAIPVWDSGNIRSWDILF